MTHNNYCKICNVPLIVYKIDQDWVSNECASCSYKFEIGTDCKNEFLDFVINDVYIDYISKIIEINYHNNINNKIKIKINFDKYPLDGFNNTFSINTINKIINDYNKLLSIS